VFSRACLTNVRAICHMTLAVYQSPARPVQSAPRQARKGSKAMAGTAVDIDPRLIAFVLPSVPESVRMARFHVRATLGFHQLGEYADDAEVITSELVSNAIQHVCNDGTEAIGVTLARTCNPEAVTVVVSDSSPEGPATRETPTDSEQGRGLQIVAALSAYWDWHLEADGKAIFAVLAKETSA
jgi:anti-sigma regulatory factor (Ser/Thr protein kinase)